MKIKLWLNTKKFREIALIFLLSFLVFTWFKKDLVVSGGDFPFNFSPNVSFPNFFSVWNSSISLGIVNIQAPPHLFYQFLYYLASLVNFPLWLAQRILYYFLFLGGGLGIYFLVKRIFNLDNLLCFLAAVFYMINPYSLVFVWGVPTLLIFAYAAFPILFFLFVRGLARRQVRDIFWFCLAGFIFSAFYGVFSYVLVLWFLLFSFFIYQIIFQKDKKENIQKLKFTLALFSAWLLTNFYWLLPYLSGFQALASGAAYQSSLEILIVTTSKAFLLNSFRLFGYNVFGEKFMGIDPFFPYAGAYQSIFFVFLSFLVPLLIFLGIVFHSDQKRREAIYFLFLALLSLFVYKGVQPPFGGIYLSLIERFPLLTAFRNPLDKIGPLLALSYAVLFGYSLFQLKELLKNRRELFRGILFVLCVGLFLIFGFPFWTGQVFYPGGTVRPSLLAKLPPYYYDLAGWLKKQPEEFRILPIPLGGLFGTPYDWDYGHGGADPLTFVLPKPLIYNDSKIAKLIASCLISQDQSLFKDDRECLSYLLGLVNGKYLLVHNDIKENYFNIITSELNLMRERLKTNYFENISFEKSFERVDLYRISDESFLPRFYFPQKIIYVNGGEDSWEQVVVNEKEPIKRAFFIREFDTDINNNFVLKNLEKNENLKRGKFYSVLLEDKPEVEITEKGIGRFKLSVKNMKKSNFLISSENFDPGWVAYQDGKKLRHQIVNSFANAWWVENQSGIKEFQIEIRFWPQKLFYFGALISILSYLLVLLFVVYEKRKRTLKN